MMKAAEKGHCLPQFRASCGIIGGRDYRASTGIGSAITKGPYSAAVSAGTHGSPDSERSAITACQIVIRGRYEQDGRRA